VAVEGARAGIEARRGLGYLRLRSMNASTSCTTAMMIRILVSIFLPLPQLLRGKGPNLDDQNGSTIEASPLE
jgi:hypothetical protein